MTSLFEPVKIGPVTARKNRFYQVPHCTGMGYDLPHSVSRLREAEGRGRVGRHQHRILLDALVVRGRAPIVCCALWDESDVKTQSLTAEKIRKHGALAGVELWHGGNHSPNRWSRETPLSPSGSTQHAVFPMQTRAMDKEDIRNLRRWQVQAAKRAKRAGFDIVYVYAGHGYLPFQFITQRWNQRTDEYGGSIENRSRLLREMIEETKDAIGDTCAVAVRLAVDELLGPKVCRRRKRARLSSRCWPNSRISGTSMSPMSTMIRSPRALVLRRNQEKFTSFVKKLTTKPVVGVGRFTSPDTMVDQVKRGILDFIGAARPSIADPFIPLKIDEGREEDIRECIGCNICRAQNNTGVPIRCTQNPTMGEEYRRGWHPEIMNPKKWSCRRSGSRSSVRGRPVSNAPCRSPSVAMMWHSPMRRAISAGRLNFRNRNCRALSAWARVRDYRLGQIAKLPNIEIFRESRMDKAALLETDYQHIILATGAIWRRDGVGHNNYFAVPGTDAANVLTPDDIMRGARRHAATVIVYDDDQYYMAAVIAEKLVQDGLQRHLRHARCLMSPLGRSLPTSSSRRRSS